MTPPVPVTPDEMAQAVRRAGLTLNPGQLADLVLAWQQLVGLAARIPRNRPFVDDFTTFFRLAPPVAAAPAAGPARKAARPRKAAAAKTPARKPAAGKKRR